MPEWGFEPRSPVFCSDTLSITPHWLDRRPCSSLLEPSLHFHHVFSEHMGEAEEFCLCLVSTVIPKTHMYNFVHMQLALQGQEPLKAGTLMAWEEPSVQIRLPAVAPSHLITPYDMEMKYVPLWLYLSVSSLSDLSHLRTSSHPSFM